MTSEQNIPDQQPPQEPRRTQQPEQRPPFFERREGRILLFSAMGLFTAVCGLLRLLLFKFCPA